jgi:hypothetical protein
LISGRNLLFVPDTAFTALLERELNAIIQPFTHRGRPDKSVLPDVQIAGVVSQRFAAGSMKAFSSGSYFHRDDHGGCSNKAQSQVLSGIDVLAKHQGLPLSTLMCSSWLAYILEVEPSV